MKYKIKENSETWVALMQLAKRIADVNNKAADSSKKVTTKLLIFKTNTMTENQNFGQAIEALKQGKKVARNGWNGKGMYLTLIQGYPVNGHLQCHIHESVPFMPHGAGKEHGLCPDGSPNITNHNAGNMLSHIVMKTAGDSQYWGVGYNDYVPWLASQTDILSEDWCILD